jgi:dihydroorotate dehydrogenase electron transfer subunit
MFQNFKTQTLSILPRSGVVFCVKVAKVVKHTKDIATIYFDRYIHSYPGQFLMVNVFGYEEIPLSLSSPKSITVKAVGETTRALVEIEEGELLGLRGPFGNPFTPAKKALIVAGGIGIAPMLYLYEYLVKKGADVHVVFGARTEEELIFKEKFKSADLATDDGSYGFKGNVVELLKAKEMKLDEFEKIYCCGPEVMLKALFKLFKEREVLSKAEFSLERYMRCGIGLCGSCVLENGLRVCKEGPVFRGEDIPW